MQRETRETSARELVHLPAVSILRQKEVLNKFRKANAIASQVHLFSTEGDDMFIRENTTARLIQGNVVASMHTHNRIAVVGGGGNYGCDTSVRGKQRKKKFVQEQKKIHMDAQNVVEILRS